MLLGSVEQRRKVAVVQRFPKIFVRYWASPVYFFFNHHDRYGVSWDALTIRSRRTAPPPLNSNVSCHEHTCCRSSLRKASLPLAKRPAGHRVRQDASAGGPLAASL